jgi:hypothetical protein
MKCHYETVDGKKFFIPGCVGAAISHDISKCTCYFRFNDSNKELNKMLQDAYVQGYRKANITAGVIHGDIEEKTAIKEFKNWFKNKER